jgi:hypothetical protein
MTLFKHALSAYGWSADLSPIVEHTDWGDARRLAPPTAVAGAAMQWARPARKLGSAVPAWH